MILHKENSKVATKKLPELSNEFSEAAGYKINTQKSFPFYTLTMKDPEREIIETIQFTITSKRIKYLGINLPKDTKDLHFKKKKKTVMKETDDAVRKIYHVLGLEESILSK